MEQIDTHLWEQIWHREERKPHPSPAIIDNHSVKSSETSDERGYDAGKKVNGRKRHILVDTMGLPLRVLVRDSDIQDRAKPAEYLRPPPGG